MHVEQSERWLQILKEQENPCEAVLVNVTGTRQVADMAVKYGAEKMIMVSTDKAVNPTNVMGCSKRLAEIYVQSLSYAIKEGKVKGCTKFVTTPFTCLQKERSLLMKLACITGEWY